MVDFKRLADKAKEVIDKRGGTGALKEDADELRDIAQSKGSLKDKATEAADAVKDPGAPGGERSGRPETPGGAARRKARQDTAPRRRTDRG